MFFNQDLLTNEGPLATVWLAANLEKKLTKSQLIHTNISKTAEVIIVNSDERKENIENESLVTSQPIALRLSGQLLYGVVKIYHKKEKYLLDDVSNVLIKLKTIFKSNSNNHSIILPANKTIANVQRLMLPDTITEHNIINQLLRKPLNLNDDEDDEDTNPRFEQSIEQGRNISRLSNETTLNFGDIPKARPSIIEEQPEDEDDGMLFASQRANEDDLELAGPNDDLVLDFGNDLDFGDDNNNNDNDVDIPGTPQNNDDDIYNQDFNDDITPAGNAEDFADLHANRADQTIEQGRDQQHMDTDLTFGADTLMKENETTNNDEKIFETAPLETVEENERHHEEQEEEQRSKKLKKLRSSTVKKNDRKRKLLFDEEIELSKEEFELKNPREKNYEYEKETNERNKLRKKLLNNRLAFYLEKDYSNPSNLLFDSSKFKTLWDVNNYRNPKKVDNNEENLEKNVSPVHEEVHDENNQIPDDGFLDFNNFEDESFPQVPDYEAFPAPEVPEKEPDQTKEKSPEIEGLKSFDLDLNYGDHFNPDETKNDESEISSEEEEEAGEITQTESFLQKVSTNEFASSLVESKIPDEEQSEQSDHVKEVETMSQLGSQYGETASTDHNNHPCSISKSTLKIGSVLKNQNKSISFEKLVENDFNNDFETPLSTDPKKEKIRCFFELLVLASGDAINLKQNELFGEIKIGLKSGLFERF